MVLGTKGSIDNNRTFGATFVAATIESDVGGSQSYSSRRHVKTILRSEHLESFTDRHY